MAVAFVLDRLGGGAGDVGDLFQAKRNVLVDVGVPGWGRGRFRWLVGCEMVVFGGGQAVDIRRVVVDAGLAFVAATGRFVRFGGCEMGVACREASASDLGVVRAVEGRLGAVVGFTPDGRAGFVGVFGQGGFGHLAGFDCRHRGAFGGDVGRLFFRLGVLARLEVGVVVGEAAPDVAEGERCGVGRPACRDECGHAVINSPEPSSGLTFLAAGVSGSDF